MSTFTSPVSSAFPSYDEQPVSHPPIHPNEDYHLPDPRSSRPLLSVSISGSFVGHPEGWSDHSRVDSASSELPPPTNPTPSPRARTTSLGGKKKKASPRTSTVPLPVRKRSPASCAPCRKKKLKCDRSLPCSSCIAKGTECVWEGDATPLYIKNDHELQGTRELQAQASRLD
ncbi:Zn(II)2Cys6 transcription factor domain-containing protein [Sporobolomyces salmoneus]|uniref:Zn(II)2Cys6 transcription factor domain-containing protein n=1 Tax=Sporobolomyces salmoneus TaxID=183962 RepID=UPI00317BC750